MVDTFDTDIAKCNLLLDKIARGTGLEIGMSVNPTVEVINDWRDLNTDNARLKAEVQGLKRDNNRLKRWIAVKTI